MKEIKVFFLNMSCAYIWSQILFYFLLLLSYSLTMSAFATTFISLILFSGIEKIEMEDMEEEQQEAYKETAKKDIFYRMIGTLFAIIITILMRLTWQ